MPRVTSTFREFIGPAVRGCPRAARLLTGLLLLTALPPMLAGCAGTGGSGAVAWQAESCCTSLAARRSFTLAMENLPSFLEPYFLTEVIPVLQARGLAYVWPEATDVTPDLVVWLAFEQIELDQAERPESDRSLGLGPPARFLARVRVELIDGETGETLASGVLARMHTALPGGYMHDERAREGIRAAFTNLLETLAPPTPSPRFREDDA